MTDPPEKNEQPTSSDRPPTGEEADGPRMVDCVKFGKRMEGLAKPPLKGEVGQKIFDNVSKEAWRMWLEHSKMIINEFRLDLMSEHGQQVWMSEMERFLWGEGSQLPPDYVPQRSK